MEGPYGKPMTQTIEFERVGDGTHLAITSRFDTTEERDNIVKYAQRGATWGWDQLDALLKRLAAAWTRRIPASPDIERGTRDDRHEEVRQEH